MLATMRSAFRALARSGARWTDVDGVGALVTPSVPERSVFNSVVYERGADVARAYERLASRYDGAWTVWVPDEDVTTAAFLEERGHTLDASPAAMVLDLASFEPPSALPRADTPALEVAAEVNEASYPWQDGTMRRGLLQGVSADDFRLYATEGASVLGIHDCGGDAGVFFVATRPDARGRGLAAGLLGRAVADARERGCDISTLQATRMGEPVYARVGYRTIMRLQMWEKR